MMTNKKDLAIVYRIYPGVSKIPIIYPEDKFELSKVAVKSLKDALGKLNVKFWIILDNCPDIYENLFKEILFNYDVEFLHLNGVGNYGTYEKQIEILINQNIAETVYLAEDDYLFLPNALEEAYKYFNSSNDVDFITIYDNLDYYKRQLHSYQSVIRFHSKTIWRTVSCTTGSFMTSKTLLKKNRWIFETLSKNNNFDSSLWMSLTKKNILQLSSLYRFLKSQDRDLIRIIKSWLFCWRQILFGKKYKLWAPLPSLGTHLDKDGISPTINWKDVYEKYN